MIDESWIAGSEFRTVQELEDWLAFVEWLQDPEADAEAYYWCAGSWWPTERPPEPVSTKPRRRPYLPRNDASTATAWVKDAIAGLPATLTTEEACATLRMSRRNLYRIVAKGKLRARKMS